MPKRKRTAEERVEYYRKKMAKYEKLASGSSNGQQIAYSPTGYSAYGDLTENDDSNEAPELEVDAAESDAEQSENDQAENVQDPPAEQTISGTVQTDIPPASTSTDIPLTNVPATSTELPPASVATQSDTTKEPQKAPETPALDPEVLKALGEATDGSPEFGEDIHTNLAQLWLPLLKKGLTKEPKEALMKDYLVPANCKLLQAPKLNAEIMAAVSELARNRDKKMSSAQQQLGVGITAINRALSVLLQSDDKVKAIKCLSDACRILCDLHYLETHNRTKLITPSLDKSFCTVIQDIERDETLFGNTLSEKIKASKAIERQGRQIKKPNPKPPVPSPAASTRPAHQGQGNWTGHPRSANRGGRGGGRRPNPTDNSSHRAQPASQSQSQNSTKPRAPPAQRR